MGTFGFLIYLECNLLVWIGLQHIGMPDLLTLYAFNLTYNWFPFLIFCLIDHCVWVGENCSEIKSRTSLLTLMINVMQPREYK